MRIPGTELDDMVLRETPREVQDRIAMEVTGLLLGRSGQSFAVYDQRQMSNAAYHRWTGYVSNSMLSVFLRSHREFEALYVTQEYEPPGATSAMELGTVAHAAILEPHVLEHVCLEIPARVLSAQGHRRGKAWTEFRDAHTDRILLSAAEMQAVRGMFAGAYAHPVAKRILTAEGPVEQSIFWIDRESGVERRCRPDKQAGEMVVCDLKTTNDLSPRAFERTLAQFGYHRQAQFYLDGIEAAHGRRPTFVFVVVCTKPPYRTMVFELDDEAIEQGREAVQLGLARLAECRKTGDWSDVGEDQITLVTLPAWAAADEQFQLEV